MVVPAKWTDAEKRFAAALQSEPGEWTPDCLDPEIVLQVIDGTHKMTVAYSNHLADCAYCKRAFAQTRQLLRWSPSAVGGVTLNDGGHSLSLKPDGTLHSAWDIPSGLMRDVIALLTTRRVDVSRSLLHSLGGLRGAVRGAPLEPDLPAESGSRSEDKSFALLHPVGAILLEDRPTFRWQPLPDAARYRLEIFVEGSAKQAIVEEQVIEATWMPSMPLLRGTVLRWKVTAVDSQGNDIVFAPKPPVRVRFRILTPSQALRLEKQLHTYAHSPLLRGLLAVKAGQLDYAEQAFNILEQVNPGNSLPQELLKSVQDLRSSPS
jgi:hypothetical protein